MAGIDLSALQPPTVSGLVLTLDEIRAESLAWLQAEHGWEVAQSSSDPAYRLVTLWAYREQLARRAIYDSLLAASLAYATKENLDHIGATYAQLARLEGETDDAYRERIRNQPERTAVGLSGLWYEFTARLVTGVADARVTSPSPGEVDIHILADETLLDDRDMPLYPRGVPDAGLLAAVRTAVTAPAARQQTDTVDVLAASRQLYDVRVQLTLLAEPDAGTVLAAARAALGALAARQARLGAGLTSELVAGATVDPAAVRSAAVTISTVSKDGNTVTPVAAIAGADGVAPLARTLTVEAA